jgi:hypothetical protein
MCLKLKTDIDTGPKLVIPFHIFHIFHGSMTNQAITFMASPTSPTSPFPPSRSIRRHHLDLSMGPNITCLRSTCLKKGK